MLRVALQCCYYRAVFMWFQAVSLHFPQNECNLPSWIYQQHIITSFGAHLSSDGRHRHPRWVWVRVNVPTVVYEEEAERKEEGHSMSPYFWMSTASRSAVARKMFIYSVKWEIIFQFDGNSIEFSWTRIDNVTSKRDGNLLKSRSHSFSLLVDQRNIMVENNARGDPYGEHKK